MSVPPSEPRARTRERADPDRLLIEREWLHDQGISGTTVRSPVALGEGHHAKPCSRAVDLGQEVERRRHFRTENRFPRQRLGNTDEAAADAPSRCCPARRARVSPCSPTYR